MQNTIIENSRKIVKPNQQVSQLSLNTTKLVQFQVNLSSCTQYLKAKALFLKVGVMAPQTPFFCE